MSRFWEHATKLMEAAEAASEAGSATADWTVVIGAEGGVSLLADSDWPLESLQRERGARMVYRVRRGRASVRVEGRAGSRTCLFEAVKPEGAARLLPADFPRPQPLATAPLPAGSSRLLPAAWD